MSWVFVGTDFFSPKSSNAKNSTLGTSEANSGGKKPRIILREVRYLLQLHINPFSEWHLAGASVSYGHFF